MLKGLSKFLTLLTCIALSNVGFSADIKSFGVPYVQNYTKNVYQSGNQNWAVSKDPGNGVMYFGNGEGLLVFDGRYWQQYVMPNHLIVRAVAADGKGRVYAGGFGEFGYWSFNSQGKFVYKSLTGLVPKQHRLKDEIWKIHVSGSKVYFQSFASIFIYENGKIEAVKAEQPNFFLFTFKVRDRVFAEVMLKGLYELKERKLELIKGSEIIGTSGVLSVLPFGEDKFLIGTAKNGLFLYDGISVQPWGNQANNFLKAYQLNAGAVIMGRYFAFGTILNGIVILDERGRIVQRINKTSGLQNNTVLSLYSDDEQNLWAGLDNGIDRVELNSPLYFYFDKKGDLGTVYSSIIHDKRIYLGTNQGLFYSNLDAASPDDFQYFDFRFVPNSQGQVWNLSLLDGQLLCGHNNGTFMVNGDKLSEVSHVSGGWTIKRLNSNPNLLIQGSYTGLVIYKKDDSGRWIFSHVVSGFGEPARYVEQDSRGNIWVGHAYKGIYKLQLSADLRKVVSMKYYAGTNGLPGSYNINVFELEHRIVFSSDSSFYVYDDISDRFFRYNQLNKPLGSFAYSNKIIPAGGGKYWFIDHGKTAIVSFGHSGRISMDSTTFTMLNGRMVQYYENISRISNTMHLISIDDGFAIYNASGGISNGHSSHRSVLIRKAENLSDTTFTLTESSKGTIEIPYKKNNLRISFSLPYYRTAKIEYQYVLDGYSSEWSSWSVQANKEFSNLSPGNYTFRVRARIDGRLIATETTLDFTILPPWYLSGYAIAFYILLHVIAFLGLRRLYFIKLRRDKEKIHQRLEKEKEELLRQEAQANEQKIIKLRNEQLQADLDSKSRELTSSAMNIVYKNELLQKIRDEIYSFRDSNGKKLSSDQLKRIEKVIDEGLNDERDWNIFETSFNETHENFFKKLKAQYPELVPNDLKLCAYLRMNMSSKEIASLLNITLRGVEIRRYRLRKKLNLDHDKNLAEFFMQI